MKPTVITFLSHKGGSGKTTAAVNLAVAAHLDGKAALLIDLDDGASATEWHRARADKQPHVQPTHHAGIAELLKVAEQQGVDWALIDTKGGTERASIAALEIADLAIVPVIVSAMDLRQSMHTVRLCRDRGIKPYVLLGDFDAVGPEEADSRQSLEQMGIPVLPGGLGHRKAFKRSLIPGLGVLEYEPKGAAADEVRRLYATIQRVLESQRVSKKDRKRVSRTVAP
jgi:chromosome partitioning protein